MGKSASAAFVAAMWLCICAWCRQCCHSRLAVLLLHLYHCCTCHSTWIPVFLSFGNISIHAPACRHTPGRARSGNVNGHGGVWVENQKVLAKKKNPKAWWLQLTLMTTLGLTGINVMQSFCRFVGKTARKLPAKPLGKLLESNRFDFGTLRVHTSILSAKDMRLRYQLVHSWRIPA